MNTHFNIVAMLSLTLTLALMPSGRTQASPILDDNSAGIFSLQEDAGSEVALMPVTPPSDSLFRDVPSLSGRYSAGKMTFLPYIGAGFGAGYNSDLDRAFVPIPPPQQNLNLGSPLGQKMLPNEFQMGIRIPF